MKPLRCLWVDDTPIRARSIAARPEFARLIDGRVVESCAEVLVEIERGFVPDLLILDVVMDTGRNSVDEALNTNLVVYPWLLLSDRARSTDVHDKHDVVCMSSHALRARPAQLAIAIVEAAMQMAAGTASPARSFVQLLVHDARRAVDAARFELLSTGLERMNIQSIDARLDEVSDWLDRIALQ
jgi:hypothetical protein